MSYFDHESAQEMGQVARSTLLFSDLATWPFLVVITSANVEIYIPLLSFLPQYYEGCEVKGGCIHKES